MRYKIFDSEGNHVNSIVADEAFVEEHFPGRYELLPEPPVPPPPVPGPLSPISPRQMLIGLLSIGITEAMVLAELEAIADPQERAIALIEWQRAGTIDRGHPLVDELAATFELPPEQVDDLWRWAAGL
ncbi:hypothetical protein [Shinella sp. DD12]|uniref:hypothetical protein n=1 Tax=Shinella sp. DD12 TaxID=1410620 RepID=UPI0003C56EF6|nr:hypothetical protein [Shinella sp. DD12]EYR81882.1 hypothetical protein SHLA_4c001740 [Shinella sp. DD12]